MRSKDTYGQVLRGLRRQAGKTMGEVASAIGVSTPFYSDVEHDKKNPFSPERVSYDVLAQVLGTTAKELYALAAKYRGRVELNLARASAEVRETALLLTRTLTTDGMSDELARQIRKMLEGDSGRTH